MTARVGSISDNQLGGWYAYRASKAALNMLIKNIAIETKRTHPKSIVVGLHPGTVDSALSKPFQHFIDKEHIFTPEYSVKQLTKVIESLTENDSGKLFDWKGLEIAP